MRFVPKGYIPTNVGRACYAPEDTLITIAASANSVVAKLYLDLVAPTLTFTSSDVAGIPIPSSRNDKVQRASRSCLFFSQTDWDSQETSWGFKRSPLI